MAHLSTGQLEELCKLVGKGCLTSRGIQSLLENPELGELLGLRRESLVTARSFVRNEKVSELDRVRILCGMFRLTQNEEILVLANRAFKDVGEKDGHILDERVAGWIAFAFVDPVCIEMAYEETTTVKDIGCRAYCFTKIAQYFNYIPAYEKLCGILTKYLAEGIAKATESMANANENIDALRLARQEFSRTRIIMSARCLPKIIRSMAEEYQYPDLPSYEVFKVWLEVARITKDPKDLDTARGLIDRIPHMAGISFAKLALVSGEKADLDSARTALAESDKSGNVTFKEETIVAIAEASQQPSDFAKAYVGLKELCSLSESYWLSSFSSFLGALADGIEKKLKVKFDI